MLENLKETRNYNERVNDFIAEEERLDDPEAVPDRAGASLLEVQTNKKYGNVKKVLDNQDLQDQEEYKKREKAREEVEELEKLLMVDKLDLELQKEAAKLQGIQLYDKTRGTLEGGIARGNFPHLNEIEFRVLYTERVTTYLALINNDLNKEKKFKKSSRKKADAGKALKNVYELITKKKPLFKVK
jgi:hypothetical protein